MGKVKPSAGGNGASLQALNRQARRRPPSAVGTGTKPRKKRKEKNRVLRSSDPEKLPPFYPFNLAPGVTLVPSYGCTLVRRGVVRRDGALSLRGYPPPPVGFARPPGAAARGTRQGEMEGATPLFKPLVRHRGRGAGAPLCAHQLPSPLGGRSLHSDPCGKAVKAMRKLFAEEQIIGVLKQAGAGAKTLDLRRQMVRQPMNSANVFTGLYLYRVERLMVPPLVTLYQRGFGIRFAAWKE